MLARLTRYLPWRKKDHTYLKNFLFGVEDSLVSTVGLLSGVAAASATTPVIITTGLVLIVVEGFSMGIGSFLTEETAEEIDGQFLEDGRALRGGLTMFVSYFFAGLLPLSPYFFFPTSLAVWWSVVASLFGLFVLGWGTARYFGHNNPLKRGLKTLLMGSLAVFLGITIGKIFHI